MKKTILIVEDVRSLREAIEKKCIQEGFAVITADNGETGLERAMSEHPDIILLDIVMPKMDGLAFLQALRKDEPWGKDANVMVLTNLSETETLQKIMEYGVFSYYVKSDWKLADVIQQAKKTVGLT